MKRNVFIPDPLARALGLDQPDINVSRVVQDALRLYLGAGETVPAATRLRAALRTEERAQYPRPALIAEMQRQLANRHVREVPR